MKGTKQRKEDKQARGNNQVGMSKKGDVVQGARDVNVNKSVHILSGNWTSFVLVGILTLGGGLALLKLGLRVDRQGIGVRLEQTQKKPKTETSSRPLTTKPSQERSIKSP